MWKLVFKKISELLLCNTNECRSNFPKSLKNTYLEEVLCREAVLRRCSVKKVYLKISQNSQKNTFAGVSFLIKFQAEACRFIKKETPALVFSCKFCKIFKNTFFYRTPPVILLFERLRLLSPTFF